MTDVLMAVQRYGSSVPGGAEALCRMFAEQLVRRGHRVSVLTSCAVDYATWEDSFTPGVTEESGVRVRREPVAVTRDQSRFAPLSARVLAERSPSPVVQEAWFHEQGPIIADYDRILVDEALSHDVVAFFTYLYPPSVTGVPLIAPLRPTVLHPTAHDERPFRIPMVRRAFDDCAGIAYSTDEERELVRRRYRPNAVDSVVGIGFDAPPDVDDVLFRAEFGLGDRPYLLYLGRIDPNKAADEAIAYTQAFRRRTGSDLTLVMMGAQAMPVENQDGLLLTGFVDDPVRWSALAGATALIQPSYQESFSMALAESWLMRRPALVQGECDVLDGLARRAGGALAYRGFAEFEASLQLLLDDPGRGDRLGDNGWRHITSTYGWDSVMGRYEQLLDRARASWSRTG